MASETTTPPHPLAPLSPDEFIRARDILLGIHQPTDALYFKAISLKEPKRAELAPFLAAEHAGNTSRVQRPPRLAQLEYDVYRESNSIYNRAIVNLDSGNYVSGESFQNISRAYFNVGEFSLFQDICVQSEVFRNAMAEFALPEGFTVAIDAWPYGGPDQGERAPRYMQGLVFARDTASNNPDSNRYAYPIPIIPVMDWFTRQIVRVDRLATGSSDDGLEPAPEGLSPRALFQNSRAAEYVPELLDVPLRDDLKPLNVVQPEGASFKVHPDGLIEWQKWRFRLSFTPREGAVLHDICYENRSIFYRLSYSELTVPYGDPRPPFHRKQAFDFGDGGCGRAANNLELGCDCLGAVHYFDGYLAAPDGTPTLAKSVICIHEQDNGILWKHTNTRTHRAVVTRNREMVLQFIVTLANYDYIFAYKLDLAGGITLETRATGIMSVVGIEEGKTSSYGNVVAPGILAQNHQHIFAVRIDPAIDSYSSGDTQVTVEESARYPVDGRTNPFGNHYTIQRRRIDKAAWIDSEPRLNRLIKLENSKITNPVSGRPVAYRLGIPATQLLLADDSSTVAKRAKFAQHAVWVTGYRDGELWAAGEFTNQSREETGGVADMVKRGDWFVPSGQVTNGTGLRARQMFSITQDAQLSTPVVWTVFGLTHNPRVEDWPVMPVEIHQIHLKPSDFFVANPALDVPSKKDEASVSLSTPCCEKDEDEDVGMSEASVQQDPASHLQGGEPDITATAARASVTGRRD